MRKRAQAALAPDARATAQEFKLPPTRTETETLAGLASTCIQHPQAARIAYSGLGLASQDADKAHREATSNLHRPASLRPIPALPLITG